jgi:hypothetical protein
VHNVTFCWVLSLLPPKLLLLLPQPLLLLVLRLVLLQAIASDYPSDADALGVAAEARMNISPWCATG